MTALRKNVEFAKRILADRVGNAYVYGGTWSATNLKQGCDCSALVADMLGAVTKGTAMIWGREAEGSTTETYRYIPVGGVGPFGTIRVASPGDIPADAAVKIALHHGPGGGANSHMWCEVDGVRGESAGSKGCVTGTQARAVNDSYATAWAYLPGPITEDGTPRTETTPVTVKGLDYAGGRPAGAAIKAAGYAFVVRYLSSGGASLPGKQLIPNEANDLRNNGVDIVSNWETTATRMLAGYNAGVADAQAALAQVLACGGRSDRPIYFSADWDATPAQQTQINDYLRGAATVIGAQNVGIYGGFWPVSRALDAGVAKWAWQTHAWSGSNWDSRAQLEQLIGFVTVGGVQCDVNIARTTDFGQWSGQPAATPTPAGGISMADAASLKDEFDGVANGKPLPWRLVHMLREALPGDLSTQTTGDQEAPNESPSVFDQVATLAKILTRRYKGKDIWDMVCEIHDAVVK